MSEYEFVRLANFQSETDATLAKAMLEEHSIQSTIAGMEPSALGFSLEGEGAIELFVMSQDVEKARKLIADIAAAEQEEITPAWSCACGEDVDEGFWVCWNCGAEYGTAGQA